ncbi:hypothetical protein [Termitidicoccus mucosus]|uniref:hypothetical protein n=1 Tax=Termitidicoccus mucosus TaxID=1184151 RepID=UPI003182F2D5
MISLSLFMFHIVGVTLAQSSPQEMPVPNTAETTSLITAGEGDGIDPELAALKAVRVTKPGRFASAAEFQSARTAEARAWLEQAAKLRSYQEKAVAPENHREARKLEYTALLNAARAGDPSGETRRLQMLENIRSDKSFPAGVRCEMVAHSQYHNLQKRLSERKIVPSSADGRRDSRRNQPGTPDEARAEFAFDAYLAECEQVERALIEEFPDAPNGYEGLLCIARDSSQERGAAIVAELMEMKNLPLHLINECRIMQKRYGLTGRRLTGLLPLTDGKETWIYSWSKDAIGGAMAVKALAERFPGKEFVGICLDKDTEAARRAAETGGPPGQQVYDASGEIAAELGLTSPALLYIADESGCIRSVSGMNEARRLVSALPKAGISGVNPPSSATP